MTAVAPTLRARREEVASAFGVPTVNVGCERVLCHGGAGMALMGLREIRMAYEHSTQQAADCYELVTSLQA